MLESLFANTRDYLTSGGMYMAGFDPVAVTKSGSTVWEGIGLKMRTDAGGGGASLAGSASGMGKSLKNGGPGFGARAWNGAPGVIGMGAAAYGAYSGYQEGGFGGMKDAFVWDLAASAGAARFAYSSVGSRGGIKAAGTVLKSGGMLAGGARFAGAGIGATIGQSLAGTPGAFIGGFLGAAPMAALMRHPGVAAAGLAVGAAATVGYGAYNVVKGVGQMGARHAQLKRGLDTSGSLAAFNTRGANTMRGRAVQAMHKSHLNARSALGQEANFMHAPGKNYHSRYR